MPLHDDTNGDPAVITSVMAPFVVAFVVAKALGLTLARRITLDGSPEYEQAPTTACACPPRAADA